MLQNSLLKTDIQIRGSGYGQGGGRLAQAETPLQPKAGACPSSSTRGVGHQELGRAYRAGGKQDFAAGGGTAWLAGSQKVDADDAPAVQDQAFRLGMGHHRQIGPPFDRAQKGLGGAPAHALALVHLEVAAAFVVAAIEVLGRRDPALRCRAAEGIENLPGQALLLDPPFALPAMHFVLYALGTLDPDTRTVRELVALLCMLTLMVMAFAHQGIEEPQRLQKLVAKWRAPASSNRPNWSSPSSHLKSLGLTSRLAANALPVNLRQREQ